MRRTIADLSGLLCSVLVPVVGCGWLYLWAGERQYEAFWNATAGAQLVYTEPADERYVQSFRRMRNRALRLGFTIGAPRLRQSNSTFGLWAPRWERSPYAAAVFGNDTTSWDAGVILIDHTWMMTVSDVDVDCVIAHELGHIVSVRSNRFGHRTFDDIWCLPEQQFADAIGRMLCGFEPYNAMMRRLALPRPMVPMTCDVPDLTTPVP